MEELQGFKEARLWVKILSFDLFVTTRDGWNDSRGYYHSRSRRVPDVVLTYLL